MKSRPSDYFWNKATSTTTSSVELPGEEGRESNNLWLDYSAPAFSESEDESTPKQTKGLKKSRKRARLAKLRRIAFKAFTPKADGTSHKNNIVTTTEVVSRQTQVKELDKYASDHSTLRRRMTIFQSWKARTHGTQTQVKKMVVVLRARISASSPPEAHPKTWDDYHRFYGNEQIDVLNPPLPPTQNTNEGEPPSAFESRFYMAPRPANEKVRQLVLNRLDVFGGKAYDATEEGMARSEERTKIGDQLIENGKAPSSVECSWEHTNSISTTDTGMNVEQTQAILDGAQSGQLPPETLEQHPVFRKIVKQCRETFGTALSMLSVLDEDRQIFLAESGLGGLRDISRDIGFCAHTLLSGRKGFTILDTHKDWRFENGPLVQNFGSRFYAGVPLMAPNLDGSPEAEENSCPIGTLCVVDTQPRDSFGVDDRKKLVYMAEYARREIENWFAKKMDQKMKTLANGQETWNQELKRIITSESNEDNSLESEVLSDGVSVRNVTVPSSDQSRPLFKRFKSSTTISTALTSPISRADISLKSPTKTGPGLFDDVAGVLKPKMRKVFDLSTRLVGETLDLSLVYLAAVVPHGEPSSLGRTMVIAGHNLPLPLPVLGASLHLRALRSPEGGLLYQNPSVEESEEAALPHQNSSNPFASAMLLAVGTEAFPDSGGFVLAGYTSDPRRVFGAEDVTYMKEFAQQMTRYTSRLPL